MEMEKEKSKRDGLVHDIEKASNSLSSMNRRNSSREESAAQFPNRNNNNLICRGIIQW